MADSAPSSAEQSVRAGNRETCTTLFDDRRRHPGAPAAEGEAVSGAGGCGLGWHRKDRLRGHQYGVLHVGQHRMCRLS